MATGEREPATWIASNKGNLVSINVPQPLGCRQALERRRVYLS